MHQEGADVIKLFPAQMYTPDILKALKGIGQFAQVKIAPSGGQSPATFKVPHNPTQNNGTFF